MAKRITFTSGGSTCVGSFYGAEARRGCVIMCPGFGGTQDTPAFVATARDFAAGGLSVLTFDYRNFGESDGEPRQLVDIDGQIDDIGAAVTFARSVPEVDEARIVLWGTSLGGAHVVTAAARDQEIAAVVAQIPFNGFPSKVEGRSPGTTIRLIAAMIADWARGRLHMTPGYIPAVGGPGQLAVMASAEAERAVTGMASATWRNKVAPRALLSMMRYRPATSAPHVVAPLLVCVGERDAETGTAAAELAEAAPRGEVLRYPYGHFDFYADEIRHRVVADQIAFLGRVLLGHL